MVRMQGEDKGGREEMDMSFDADEKAEEERLEEDVPAQVSIGKRFADWRTLLSFVIAAAILILAITKSGINWNTTFHTLGHANLGLFIVAFCCYYGSFPIRTHRWRRLMHNANSGPLRDRIDRYPLWGLTQILYLSWFANVIIPAKLGDVYRAYLARRRIGVSLSRTVGTVLAERILDLTVLFPLLLAAAFLTFKSQLFSAHDDKIRLALEVGFLLAFLAAAFLVIIWMGSESVLRVLPHRLHSVFEHFRHGAISSFGHEVPTLVGTTIIIWLLEGARLTFVLWSLGLLAPGKVGVAAAIFLALGSSVLTTLPLTPGGLGFVEAFIVAVLLLLGVHGGQSTGAAVAVLDRIISYLSIAVFGFILYLFAGRSPITAAEQPVNAAPAG